MKNKTDEELVALFTSGDANAFNELYLRYTLTVKYFVRNLFLLGGDYEDLLQEGMLGLIKAVNLYKKEESSFKTFATLCIKSSLYTAIKKYSQERAMPIDEKNLFDLIEKGVDFHSSPEEEVIKKESGNEILKLLSDNLSKTELDILNLYLKGLSYENISNKTGKDLKAIDNALQRARKKLKTRLLDKGE